MIRVYSINLTAQQQQQELNNNNKVRIVIIEGVNSTSIGGMSSFLDLQQFNFLTKLTKSICSPEDQVCKGQNREVVFLLLGYPFIF